MERSEVYKILDGERDYQDRATADPSRPDMIEDFHVGDALTAMRVLLRKAEDFWYIGAEPHQEAMAFIRKIGGICVKLGEEHGMPERK